jgi:hypothetical protein
VGICGFQYVFNVQTCTNQYRANGSGSSAQLPQLRTLQSHSESPQLLPAFLTPRLVSISIIALVVQITNMRRAASKSGDGIRVFGDQTLELPAANGLELLCLSYR